MLDSGENGELFYIFFSLTFQNYINHSKFAK
jgi:hypothetical protein